MSDLKRTLKEAGLNAEFGQMDIVEFDPLCKINCSTACTWGCPGGCYYDCYVSCQPGDSFGEVQ